MPKDKTGERWWSPLRIFGPAVVLALVALIITYQFVDPAPPDRITIATGQPGSAYHLYGDRYRGILARERVEVEVLATIPRYPGP